MKTRDPLPSPPSGYLAPTALERRSNASEAALAHNRRLGWLLHLADRHALISSHDTPLRHRASLVLQLLPDLFDDLDHAARYTANTDDAELAYDQLGPNTTTDTLRLDTGETMAVIRALEGRCS